MPPEERAYFRRLRKALSQKWKPEVAVRVHDPGRKQVSPDRGYVTVLQVRLDGAGALVDASVQRSSGIDFLDGAAIAAFRAAQPFGPPPQTLVKDGKVTFNFGLSYRMDRARDRAPR